MFDFVDEMELESVLLIGHDTSSDIAQRLAINTDCVERLVLSNSIYYDSCPEESVTSLGRPDVTRIMTYKRLDRKLRSFFTEEMYNGYKVTENLLPRMVALFLHRQTRRGHPHAETALIDRSCHLLKERPHTYAGYLVEVVEYPTVR